MVLSSTFQSTLLRHQCTIDSALRKKLRAMLADSTIPAALQTYYGQMQYHLGWVDNNLTPTQSNPGKLLRPTLLLLTYEAAGAWGLTNTAKPDYLQRALPAVCCSRVYPQLYADPR